MKIENIIEYLELYPKHRPIAQKHKIIRNYIVQLYPRILNVGTDNTLEELIADCLDINRKIRRAKQLRERYERNKTNSCSDWK